MLNIKKYILKIDQSHFGKRLFYIIKMQDIDIENLILSKEYKNSAQFNSNPKPLLKLINFVKNLPVQQRSFDIIYDLIKFYRTPIFIAFLPFYERLAQINKGELQKYETSITQIAVYVKSYLQDNLLEQLKFFFVLGIPKKKKKVPEKSEMQKQFIKYIESLGKQLSKLKNQLNSINQAQLKLQIDQILAGGLDRKLNTLQLYYEQYFKLEADRIYKQYLKKGDDNSFSDTDTKYLQPRPDYESQKKKNLCCRTFFYDRQPIKEAENLVIEYKNYFYPFKETQMKILKKTVCAFLNTDGGTIYLGIHQDVNTKRRQVFGMQLNEAEKQNLMFALRKQVISCIEPDIIANKIYNISFVPVKQPYAPYHYISGRYVAKITIGYGLRNQIYSYRHEDKDYFAFRTENQVIHKQGRAILNAYRERLKKPLPIPVPIHQGPCQQPQQGRPIISQASKREQYKKKQFTKKEDFLSKNDYQNKDKKQQQFSKKEDYSNKIDYQNKDKKQKQQLINKQDFASISEATSFSQKKKYKQRDAVDFIITKIQQKDLHKELNLEGLQKQVKVQIYSASQRIFFIKVIEQKSRQRVELMLSRLQSQSKCEFFFTQRGISFNQKFSQGSNSWDFLVEMIQSNLSSKNIAFNVNDRKKILEFKTTQQAIQAFLIIKYELTINAGFIGV